MDNIKLKMEEQTFINSSREIDKHKLFQKIKYKFFSSKYIYSTLIIIIFLLMNLSTIVVKNQYSKYKNYINDCKELKRFNITKITSSKNPYLSICIPVYNMENYIERAILSILNQSFQDFEILITNDNSNDKSFSIIQNLQQEDKRIIMINHNQNSGVYSSRVDAILNAKGKYIILLDPDDMFLNQELFERLFNYNSNINLDIIEFSVLYQENNKKTIYKPKKHIFHHYHNFGKDIIYQPELSNILFFFPQTNDISPIICRTIWNKLIRNNILLKSIDYINIDFDEKYLIAYKIKEIIS